MKNSLSLTRNATVDNPSAQDACTVYLHNPLPRGAPPKGRRMNIEKKCAPPTPTAAEKFSALEPWRVGRTTTEWELNRGEHLCSILGSSLHSTN